MQRPAPICLALFVATCIAFLAGSASAAGPDMQPGLWKITTRMQLPGMPSDMPQQSFEHTECLTENDFVPHGRKSRASGGDCEISDVRTDGDTVSWTMRCDTGQGEMNGKGSITYKGDTFEGRIKTVMPGMEMVQHLKGERIGDCEK
jgi:hypothetical protein